MSQSSSVSIVSDYGLNLRGSIPGSDKRNFFSSLCVRPAVEPTQPPYPMGASPGVKRSRGITPTSQVRLCWDEVHTTFNENMSVDSKIIIGETHWHADMMTPESELNNVDILQTVFNTLTSDRAIITTSELWRKSLSNDIWMLHATA
jgi:hypothetical protein